MEGSKEVGRAKSEGGEEGGRSEGRRSQMQTVQERPGIEELEGRRRGKFKDGRKERPRVEKKEPTRLYSDPLSTARSRARMLMCR